jgi:hypothetical protein
MCIALAFAVPLIAILAAMSLSGIERPTAAQLRCLRLLLLLSRKRATRNNPDATRP